MFYNRKRTSIVPIMSTNAKTLLSKKEKTEMDLLVHSVPNVRNLRVTGTLWTIGYSLHNVLYINNLSDPMGTRGKHVHGVQMYRLLESRLGVLSPIHAILKNSNIFLEKRRRRK